MGDKMELILYTFLLLVTAIFLLTCWIKNKFNLTSLLPNSLVKGQRFGESYEKVHAKSKAFARLFRINSDTDIDVSKEMSRKEVFNLMRKNSISYMFLILLVGKFPINYYSWYEFKKIRNGKTTYRLCREIDVF